MCCPLPTPLASTPRLVPWCLALPFLAGISCSTLAIPVIKPLPYPYSAPLSTASPLSAALPTHKKYLSPPSPSGADLHTLLLAWPVRDAQLLRPASASAAVSMQAASRPPAERTKTQPPRRRAATPEPIPFPFPSFSSVHHPSHRPPPIPSPLPCFSLHLITHPKTGPASPMPCRRHAARTLLTGYKAVKKLRVT